MDSQTFRSRIVELVQKSRRAIRLYSTMGRNYLRPGDLHVSGELADAQATEWREVNAELVRRLTTALEAPDPRRLIPEVVSFRDELYSQYRSSEAELHSRHRELIQVSESTDFVKVAVLGRELVLLKAKFQASEAAYHELDSVLRKSKVSAPTIELPREAVIEDIEAASEAMQVKEEPVEAKKPSTGGRVIQLRRVGR